MSPLRTNATPSTSRTNNIQKRPQTSTVLKLGPFALDAQGKTPPFTFEVPEGAASVSIFATGSRSSTLLIDSVVDGGKKPLVSHEPDRRREIPADVRARHPLDAGQLRSPTPTMVGAFSGTASVLCPNSPGVKVKAGTWTASVKGFKNQKEVAPARGNVEVVVVIKHKVTPRGRLPLHLYFTGSDGYSAQTAKTSPAINGMIESVTARYAAIGISIGPISFKDVPKKFANVDSMSDIQNLFAQGSHKEGVGIFFTSEVLGPTVDGISGGLPGPSRDTGIPSGVAVATSSTPANFPYAEIAAKNFGLTVAHELGHFLGLFHTKDEALESEDPLRDTPLHDPRNLMSPEKSLEGNITRDQAWVLHRHPAVIPVE